MEFVRIYQLWSVSLSCNVTLGIIGTTLLNSGAKRNESFLTEAFSGTCRYLPDFNIDFHIPVG
jgi:hypothetical protein